MTGVGCCAGGPVHLLVGSTPGFVVDLEGGRYEDPESVLLRL